MPENLNLRLRFGEVSYWIFVVVAGLFALVFMVGPVAVGLLMSFTDGQTLQFPPQGWSLKWYAELFDPIASQPIHAAAKNSVQIALWTVAGAILLAVPASYGIARLGGKAAASIEPILLAPLVMPSLIYGLSALIAANLVGLSPSRWLVIGGHIAIFGPLMYRATLAVVQQIDPALEQASAMLGAGRFATFRRVTLPLLVPGVLAGSFLVFMQSLDNVSITLFLADPRTTVLPLRMFQMIEESLDVRVAAISGVLIGLSLIVLLLVQYLSPFLKPSR
ncbi:MAG: ABC transporter permease [Rhodocyclaceae bacterium]